MSRVRQVTSNLLRHYRPLFLLAIGAVVGGNLAVGLTEPGAWPCLVLAGLIGLGLSLNATAIALNDGFMPARAVAIPPGCELKYRPMDAQTRVRLLGDWLPVGRLLVSPGDVCLVAAATLPFVVVATRLAVGRS
ncbi:MAG TPA: DUF5317 family protein [Gemmataceae bacterium]|nr:DUF5317 family protein [Gemmataceae bacterium]